MRFIHNQFTFAVFSLSLVLSSNASAATSAAYAALDWNTLEVNVLGEGTLLPLDEIFVGNEAWMTNEHAVPLASSHQLFAPAYAGHPFYEPTAGIAGFEDDATAAAASAGIGSAFAQSGASINFASLGWGTAVITVAYAATAEIDGYGIGSEAAMSNVAFGATLVDFDSDIELGVAYDEAEVIRGGKPGVAADAGLLTLLFEFSASEHPLIRLDGSASAYAAGAMAAPIPAALPLMLGALGLIGVTARRGIPA